MRGKYIAVLCCLLMGLSAGAARSHCEIPCGIYDDEMRIDLIREHIDTIEKSMKMIRELTAKGEKNYNQIVRWVSNKEQHAEELQSIVYQYFMTQRIKPAVEDDTDYEQYIEKIVPLHRLLIQAMKAKQTLELDHVKQMRELVDRFEDAYFGEE